jgi:hypothetical protein
MLPPVMTLTTHAAIGAAIGTVVGNPLLGFVLGGASHFLVDMIPHGDNNLADDFRIEKKKKLPVAYVTLDAMFSSMLVVFLLALKGDDVSSLAIGAGVVGSMLPDLLVALSDIFKKNKLLKSYYRFHFFFHDFFSRRYGDTRLSYALFGQICFIAILIHFAF